MGISIALRSFEPSGFENSLIATAEVNLVTIPYSIAIFTSLSLRPFLLSSNSSGLSSNCLIYLVEKQRSIPLSCTLLLLSSNCTTFLSQMALHRK
jgi:hypothetical protein